MLVVSAHLRNEANILLNDLLFSFLVFDITYQGTQMKCSTFHFISTQINRLGHFSINSENALLAYKRYVVFWLRTRIKMVGIFLLWEYVRRGNTFFMWPAFLSL
jgi:hypothetical protein